MRMLNVWKTRQGFLTPIINDKVGPKVVRMIKIVVGMIGKVEMERGEVNKVP